MKLLQLASMLFVAIFWTTPLIAEVSWPEVRYLQGDLLEARPGVEEYFVFYSSVDLDDDLDDLDEEYQERRIKLKALSSAAKKGSSAGKRYKAIEGALKLIEQQITYLIYIRDLKFEKEYKRWIIEDINERPRRISKVLNDLKLKGLELSRALHRDFEKLEPEFANLQLIKYFILNDNDNFTFYFRKFKKQFPRSPKLAQVTHYVGEFYFQRGDWSKAAKYFNDSLKLKNKATSPYTYYMLGWTSVLKAYGTKRKAIRMTAHKEADHLFVSAMKEAESWDEHETPYPFKYIISRDLAWYWAHQNKDDTVVTKFFDKYDQSKANFEYLAFKAKIASRGKVGSTAVNLYRKVFDLAKNSRQLVEYQLSATSMYIHFKDYAGLNNLFRSILSKINKESDWYDDWDDDQEFLDTVTKTVKFKLRNVAVDVHQEAIELEEKIQKTRAKKKRDQLSKVFSAKLSAASQLYELYSVHFPNDRYYAETTLNLGNVKYQLGDYKGAARIYGVLAQKQSKVQQTAAYNGVMAAYSFVAQNKSVKLPPAGKVPKPILLNESQLVLLERIDFFVKTFPGADEKLSSEYTAAEMYFDYGHYDESFKRFRRIIEKHANTSEAENAMRTILSFYFEKKDWKNLARYAKEFITLPQVIAAGHETFLDETLTYANSQMKK